MINEIFQDDDNNRKSNYIRTLAKKIYTIKFREFGGCAEG